MNYIYIKLEELNKNSVQEIEQIQKLVNNLINELLNYHVKITTKED